MKIRILKGVSGYRWDRSSYRYSCGSVVIESDSIAHDLIKNGLAEICVESELRPIAEPPRVYAVTPTIQKKEIVHAVVKRGRKPKRDV